MINHNFEQYDQDFFYFSMFCNWGRHLFLYLSVNTFSSIFDPPSQKKRKKGDEVIYEWPLASALWVPSALSSSPAAYCSDYRLWIVTMAEYELWAAFLNRTLKIMLSFLNSFERVASQFDVLLLGSPPPDSFWALDFCHRTL